MDTIESANLGVQLTLVGLVLITFFEGLYPYPLVGLLFGIVGTGTVVMSVFSGTGDW